MNLFLINPPLKDTLKIRGANRLWYQHEFAPPIGLLYLISYLRQNGYSGVTLINGQVRRPPTDDEILDQVRRTRPDLIGLSVCGFNYYNSLRLARLFRQASPGSKIVIGGAQLNQHSEVVLDRPELDFGVVGEGEYTLLELVRALESGGDLAAIDGLVWKRDGVVVKNRPRKFPKPLDELPMPDYSLVDPHEHRVKFDDENPTASMVTSRGCPMHCRFCARHFHYYRAFSPERVVEEMLALKRIGYRSVSFFDENFSLKRDRVLRLCSLLRERGVDMSWSFRGRVDHFDEEMAQALAAAKCRRVQFGVESGVQQTLDAMNKRINLDQTRAAFRLARRHGITTLAYFLVGLPGQTAELTRRSMAFAFEIDPDFLVLCHFLLIGGSPIYEEAVAAGEVEDYILEFTRDPRPGTVIRNWDRDMSDREVFRMMVATYLRFYLRPRKLRQIFSRGRSAENIWNKLATGAGVFRRLMLSLVD